MEINYDAIKAKRKELEKYPGFLPVRILEEIDEFGYMEFLDQEGLLDDGNGYASELAWKLSKSRKLHWKERDEEFLIWIKKHPEFKDFLIEE
ncbi:hypothetical protein [Methanobrevibacter sp.]|uniref:hypothetical protein n=1 Tax=Methanobrevibacter sp. TaxID=66852 RepID=UPI0025E8C3A1|nr:hypothetical protein [Methanobrevibacter sp.]MBQ2832253.1 hypothetical protein [Methanobrevibacter sp.]